MSYHGFRAFADTWGLVILAAIFVILIVWLFRRGSTSKYERAARIPMEAPEHPEKGADPRNPTRADGDAPRQKGDDR